MEIEWPSPGGDSVSFDCHLGLGKISFYVDGNLEFFEDRPGIGTQRVDAKFDRGEHTLSWKYEPPIHTNMPLSMVWIDNVQMQ